MLTFRRILIPVDFSDFSRQAVRTCSTLFSGDEPLEVHFVYVFQPPSDAVTYDDPTPELERQLGEVVEGFTHEGPHTRTSAVLTGHPPTRIGEYAKEHGCDLIVLTTHGRTGLKHLLLGSTAERVVRTAPCPVLVLRAPG